MSYGLAQSLIGKRDRRVWLLKSTTTYNDMHEPVVTFTRHRQMWAQVEHRSVAEKYEADSTRALKSTTFRIQYATDIIEKDRIEHDNKTYKILGITELGRRELTEILTEAVEGLAP